MLFRSIYDWEIVMVQYNYFDENVQASSEGIEYAASKGLGVLVMEPLKGGILSGNLPKKAENVFKKALGGYYPREVRLSYQSALHIDKNDLTKVKLLTLGDYKTYEDFFNAIGDIGVRFYFDTKENIVLDVTCCEKESLTEDLVCTIDDLNDILIDSLKLSINENMVYNSVTIDYENKFPMYNPDDFTDESGKIATITNKNSPYVDFENHIFMKDETNTYNFNLLTKDMTYADFDSSRMLFGSMAIMQDTYDNTVIQFNCKVADAVIKTNSNDMVKASIAPGFDYVYQEIGRAHV